MRTTAILAAACAAVLAGPALAGGAGEAPAPAPITVIPTAPAGTDWTGGSVGLQLSYGDVSTSGVATLQGEGMLYGLRAYYDVDFGDFVFGGGLQYDRTDIDLGGVTTLESVTRLGVRGGIDLDRNWLYATGGWAQAQTSAAAVGDSNGYFAGLGYEVFLTDTITAGAEVLYHRFEDFDLGGLDAEATTAGLSLNFRF